MQIQTQCLSIVLQICVAWGADSVWTYLDDAETKLVDLVGRNPVATTLHDALICWRSCAGSATNTQPVAFCSTVWRHLRSSSEVLGLARYVGSQLFPSMVMLMVSAMHQVICSTKACHSSSVAAPSLLQIMINCWSKSILTYLHWHQQSYAGGECGWL